MGIYDVEYYRNHFYEVEVIGNIFTENEIAYQGGPEIHVESSSFSDNTRNLILEEDCRINNSTFKNGLVGIECVWASTMIDNCTFIDLEKEIYIEGEGHPVVNRSDVNIQKVYWGYYNDWEDYNSTIMINGKLHFPDKERSEYLGKWMRDYDYEEDW